MLHWLHKLQGFNRLHKFTAFSAVLDGVTRGEGLLETACLQWKLVPTETCSVRGGMERNTRRIMLGFLQLSGPNCSAPWPPTQSPSGQAGASRVPSNARGTNTRGSTRHATGSAIILNPMSFAGQPGFGALALRHAWKCCTGARRPVQIHQGRETGSSSLAPRRIPAFIAVEYPQMAWGN